MAEQMTIIKKMEIQFWAIVTFSAMISMFVIAPMEAEANQSNLHRLGDESHR